MSSNAQSAPLAYSAHDLNELVAATSPYYRALAGKRVFLTGAAGFLGRWVLHYLARLNRDALDAPCKVIAVDSFAIARAAGRAPLREIAGFPIVGCDISTRNYIVDLSPTRPETHVDYVLHLAGIASPYWYRKLPFETIHAAAEGTQNALDLARAHGASMLFTSSSEVYGDPIIVPTPEEQLGRCDPTSTRAFYDVSKLFGETLCCAAARTFNVGVKIVRLFNAYGPGLAKDDYRVMARIGAAIVDARPLAIYGKGLSTRTFTYVTDTLAGMILALLRGAPGRAYNIGAEYPEISIDNLIARVAGRWPVTAHYENPPAEYVVEPKRRCPNINRAREELGFSPCVGLLDGVDRFLSWADTAYRSVE